MNDQAYVAGFMSKAADLGVDPEALVKTAQQQGLFSNALQSPAGQGALQFAGGMYQQLPQGVRGRVSNWASGKELAAMGNLTDQAPGGYAGSGMNRDPDGQHLIATDSRVENDEIVKDRITSYSPGTAAGYGRQFMGALSQGKLPTQTFKPTTPVYNRTVVNNENITDDNLVPRIRPISSIGANG
jgi:hypothetical protein